jgi:hypothetical protein
MPNPRKKNCMNDFASYERMVQKICAKPLSQKAADKARLFAEGLKQNTTTSTQSHEPLPSWDLGALTHKRREEFFPSSFNDVLEYDDHHFAEKLSPWVRTPPTAEASRLKETLEKEKFLFPNMESHQQTNAGSRPSPTFPVVDFDNVFESNSWFDWDIIKDERHVGSNQHHAFSPFIPTMDKELTALEEEQIILRSVQLLNMTAADKIPKSPEASKVENSTGIECNASHPSPSNVQMNVITKEEIPMDQETSKVEATSTGAESFGSSPRPSNVQFAPGDDGKFARKQFSAEALPSPFHTIGTKDKPSQGLNPIGNTAPEFSFNSIRKKSAPEVKLQLQLNQNTLSEPLRHSELRSLPSPLPSQVSRLEICDSTRAYLQSSQFRCSFPELYSLERFHLIVVNLFFEEMF